jgi:hypothetical protein
MNRFVTANDITPNRCTVIDSFSSHAAAEASIESDDEAGVFELLDGTDELAAGTRAFHDDNATIWL